LSGSLGKPGVFNDKDVINAIEIVLKSGKKHGITAGFHSVSSDPSEALLYKKKGFKLLGFSLDSIFLGDAAISALQKLKNDG
jgi:2-dehydro-3-deoxyglucarate aldolase